MVDLLQLENFHKKASISTYAGSGDYVKPQRLGFKELVFEEENWKYRDSYCGSFQSWGEEVILQDDELVWTCLYGGGMEIQFHNDKDFARQTFEFLKKAMKAKTEGFHPRGVTNFQEADFEYVVDWSGGIDRFLGEEKIFYKNKIVFTHAFFGGLVK